MLMFMFIMIVAGLLARYVGIYALAAYVASYFFWMV